MSSAGWWGREEGHLVTVRAGVSQPDRVSLLVPLPDRLVPPLPASVQVMAAIVLGKLQRRFWVSDVLEQYGHTGCQEAKEVNSPGILARLH